MLTTVLYDVPAGTEYYPPIIPVQLYYCVAASSNGSKFKTNVCRRSTRCELSYVSPFLHHTYLYGIRNGVDAVGELLARVLSEDHLRFTQHQTQHQTAATKTCPGWQPPHKKEQLQQ